MAKKAKKAPKAPTVEDRYKALSKIIAGTSKRTQAVFNDFLARVLRAVPGIANPHINTLDKFAELTRDTTFQTALDKATKEMAAGLLDALKAGDESAFNLSDRHHREDIEAWLGQSAITSIQTMEPERFIARNADALGSFFKDREGKMGLSDRVWKVAEQARGHVELSLGNALGKGTPATDLARIIKQDLLNPDKLFRRVRDENGILRLSKNARAYLPGQGVYRSSYKNALRVARTEVNMAYRSADHERWQGEDFVTGIRISLSNNHTLNGRPFVDICDDLQGVYPKTFKFTGWHPQCRCIATPVMEDSTAYLNRLLSGGDAPDQIKDTPKAFKDWLRDNEDRILKAKARGTLPYWYRDNGTFIKHQLRTPEDIARIQKAWDARREANNIIGKKDGTPKLGTGKLYADPFLVATLFDFLKLAYEKVSIEARRIGYSRMIAKEAFAVDKASKAIIMQGAKPSLTELHTAAKLSKPKNGYHVIFARDKQIKDIKAHINIANKTKFDVVLVDKQTFYAKPADLKTIGDASRDTIAKHIAHGSDQAGTVVLDIQGKVSKPSLIQAIRSGTNGKTNHCCPIKVCRAWFMWLDC